MFLCRSESHKIISQSLSALHQRDRKAAVQSTYKSLSMSWLWGRSEKVEVEEELSTDDEEESSVESIDESTSDRNDNKETTKPSAVYSDDRGSSDESSFAETSDSEDDSDFDDDEDSLVVDIVDNMSTDDDISLVKEAPSDNRDVSFDSDGDNESESEESQLPYEEEMNAGEMPSKSADQQSNGDDDDADNDDPVTTFWEKQSLLVLAAEHDRVDILKTLIKDENEEKDALLNSGIPPLHLAISFGSVNTAQSLLRMGADPSVRPNIDDVIEQRKNQPEDSKVDISNIRRFDNVSAWELAFGNALYEDHAKTKSWSLFGSGNPTDSDGNRIIKPVDMPPSKREGIRHAFTAEALRSVGADEVDRLKQLVFSGMPASIDIGGNDLYGWAVEMGALQCEEFLRPIEAAKYDEEGESSEAPQESPESNGRGKEVSTAEGHVEEENSSSFVVHRPDDEETIPQLKNRLDELDSLSNALSGCLDNLAEEVSVCHGLLLMGGGASALASHVRSLRDSKAQKLYELEHAQSENLDAERELSDLVHSTGEIGKEISRMSNSNFLAKDENNDSGDNDSKGEKEVEAEKVYIRAQIEASENKIRRLRASIADLSEQNTRDLSEVKRRGLEGGINLVRGLREELRDIDFHLSEVRKINAACKAKISMILSRVQKAEAKFENGDNKSENMTMDSTIEYNSGGATVTDAIGSVKSETPKLVNNESTSPATTAPAPPPKDDSIKEEKKVSVKIATGDSQALAVIQPGHKGFFRIDLWEVLLRIIGFERAANRRSIQKATRSTSTSRSHVMTV